MRKNLKKEKGITLIALVVTIVVLLILVGVSISMLTGENGIISQAQNAKNETEQARVEEIVDLAIIALLVKNNQNKITPEMIAEEINKMENREDVYAEENKIIFPKEKKEVEVDFEEILEPPVEDFGGNYYETDTDITIGGKPVTIPGGATVSKIPGEYESIDNGLVIYITNGEEVNWSDKEIVQKTYDQFVWIPVEKETAIIEEGKEIPKITDNIAKYNSLKEYVSSKKKYPMAVKKEDGTYSGILYDFKEEGGEVVVTPQDYTTTSSYREPDNLTSAYDNATKISGWTKNLYQEEYKKMIERVEEKEGFWVGRYETTSMNVDRATVIKGTTTGISNVSWYRMYEQQKKYKKLALTKSDSVTSSMIWGSQWDQIMIWMKEVRNEVNKANGEFYVTNAVGMGNFGSISGVDDGYPDTTKPANTGCFEVKNVYDLAGNIYDWTLEDYSTNMRVFAGGGYDSTRSRNTRADGCSNNYPPDSRISDGSRCTLY